MMTIEFNDQTFNFDMDEVTTEELVKIQRQYPDLTILGLGRGMEQGDIRALQCVYWLMQVQKGNNLLRLETVKLEKPVKFASAVMLGLIKERQELVDKAEAAVAAEKKPGKSDPKE